MFWLNFFADDIEMGFEKKFLFCYWSLFRDFEVEGFRVFLWLNVDIERLIFKV